MTSTNLLKMCTTLVTWALVELKCSQFCHRNLTRRGSQPSLELCVFLGPQAFFPSANFTRWRAKHIGGKGPRTPPPPRLPSAPHSTPRPRTDRLAKWGFSSCSEFFSLNT